MRISTGIRVAVLSLAVAGLSASRAEGLASKCEWSQYSNGMGGYIGVWDCGSCSAMYVWSGGGSWTSAGSSC